MKKDREPKNLKYWEAIAGAAAGASAGLVAHNPVAMIIAATAGTGIGTYAGTWIGQIPSLWEGTPTEVKNLIVSKLHRDLDASPLNPEPWIDFAMDQALNRLVSAKVLPENLHDERIPHTKIATFSTATWKGAAPDRYVKLLEEYIARQNHPIVVNCSCIEVACIAAVKAVTEKYKLSIRLDLNDPNGHDQIKTVRGRDEVDFLITANAPLFLSDEREIKKVYRLLLPCHTEQQYLFKKNNTVAAHIREIGVFPQSSSEEQFRNFEGLRNLSRSVKPEHISAASIVQYAENLDHRQAILAWEPLATIIRNKIGIVHEPGSDYGIWISLFANKRWLHASNAQLLEAWQEVFVSAWIHCSNHREFARKLLMRDRDFIDAFTLGAGLK